MTKPVFDLKEIRYACEFNDDASAEEFLRNVAVIANGASLLDMQGAHYVSVGVTLGDGTVARLTQLVRDTEGSTRNGILTLSADREGLAVYVPLQRNPVGAEPRKPLFAGFQRASVVGRLTGHFGPAEHHKCIGVWFDGTTLIRDESDVFVFNHCTKSPQECVHLVRDEVLLHPDCDQHSIYVSQGGYATLVERAMAPAAVEFAKAA